MSDKPAYISFGAGVQSTALLVLALEGRFDKMPEAAIFADTQWEPKAVYDHLERMKEYCAEREFPLHVVSAGDLRADALDTSRGTRGFASMPLYTGGGGGMGRRQCTREYKIDPIAKKIRELHGKKPRQRMEPVEVWIGISLDEVMRAKPSRIGWQTSVFPLLDAKMRREDCLNVLAARGIPVPEKSSCIGCPYHSNRHFLDMKRHRPDEWADVCEFDKKVRELIDADLYVHRSGTPIDTADLQDDQGDLFAEECDGYCFL